jgi:hypothetical protein
VSSPPPPAGAPISSAPIEPGRAPGGCARGGLIGCGVAAILVLICIAVFLAYVRRKPEALTDLMMRQVERNFASDVTLEEKEKLRAAYADFRKRLQERRVGSEPVERLRSILSSAGGSIGRDQVRELTQVFSGAAAPPPAGASSRAPTSSTPALAPSPAP